MTWLAWLLLGASLWLNGILCVLIYGCFRYNAKLAEDVAQAKALLSAAITDLEKRSAVAAHIVNTHAKVVSISRRVH